MYNCSCIFGLSLMLSPFSQKMCTDDNLLRTTTSNSSPIILTQHHVQPAEQDKVAEQSENDREKGNLSLL